MSNKVKDIDMKNHTYYYFNGITDIFTLFRFKFLNASSNSSKFNSWNCIFSLWNVKKSWILFSVMGIFFTSFDPTEVKNLLNSLAMSYGFCILVSSTLISWGRRFDFLFCFPFISFITWQVRLESVLHLCNNFE